MTTHALSSVRPWLDPRIGLLLAAGVAAAAGLLVALTMPHGPATAVQALLVLGMGLVVGLLAGLALPSRWALLLAPAAHIIALELARLPVVGPTVDAIRLDNAYGILALLLGRVFYALLALLPMLVGVALGIAIARHTGLWPTLARWSPAVLILLALAVLIVLPARTPPILGADGRPVAGSIAELTKVPIGGHDQAIMIRAYSADKPVILYLSGGPGQSSLPHPRVPFDDITRDFVFVAWDQPGTGKSYAALDPTDALTLDRVVADTIELSEYLCERFDEEKIYLLGESWGTTLGVLAAQRRPDLYHAFIGSGQMVSQRETDRRLYHDVLAYAAQAGDEKLAGQMRAYGEPPYADVPYAYAFVMGYYDALYKPYTPPQDYLERGSAAHIGFMGMMGSEYDLVEKTNVARGLIDMFTILYPQIQGVDFRRDVTRLDVPVYILDGEAELTARRDLALEWYAMLQAPIKRIYSFENAGHAVAFEQFSAFHRILNETIVPETYTRP